MNYSNSMYDGGVPGKQYIKHVVLLVILLVAAFVAKGFILGNASPIKLGSAPSVSGMISQSLATNDRLPLAGVDFQLHTVQTLEDGAWIIATVQPVSGETNTSTLVLQRQANKSYRVAIGPGTAFSSDDVLELPPLVLQYLKTHGVVIYEPES